MNLGLGLVAIVVVFYFDALGEGQPSVISAIQLSPCTFYLEIGEIEQETVCVEENSVV